MEHLRALYNVRAGLRILVALQAAFVAACLPAKPLPPPCTICPTR